MSLAVPLRSSLNIKKARQADRRAGQQEARNYDVLSDRSIKDLLPLMTVHLYSYLYHLFSIFDEPLTASCVHRDLRDDSSRRLKLANMSRHRFVKNIDIDGELVLCEMTKTVRD